MTGASWKATAPWRKLHLQAPTTVDGLIAGLNGEMDLEPNVSTATHLL